MHWGRQCAAPIRLPDAGPGGAPKGASPGFGGGLNAVFCLVSGASCVGKCVVGVKRGWQCSVVLAIWRRYELHLLKLLELFSFANTFADSNATEQRQHGQQGRVKRPSVHSSGKTECFLAGCFPTMQRHTLGRCGDFQLSLVVNSTHDLVIFFVGL